MKEELEVVLDHTCMLGEGPVWDQVNHRILWVDILKGEILQFNTLTSEKKVMEIGQFVGAVSLCSSGELLAALHQNFAFIRERDGNPDIRYLVIEDIEPTARFNDAKCDPAGNLWAGSMDLNGKNGGGKLVMLDHDLQVSVKIPQVSISNGMAWSNDKRTFYYIDTGDQNVVAYEYDLATFEITNKREIIKVPEEMGKPDGMTIDEEGMLWIAMWKGWRITRWNPFTGKCLFTVPLPVSQVTSCSFGGENYEDLYITSASAGLTEKELSEEPLAGSLFVIRNTGIKGYPPAIFKNSR